MDEFVRYIGSHIRNIHTCIIECLYVAFTLLFVYIHCGTIGEGSMTLRNSGEGVEESGRRGDIYAVGVDAENLRTRKMTKE